MLAAEFEREMEGRLKGGAGGGDVDGEVRVDFEKEEGSGAAGVRVSTGG